MSRSDSIQIDRETLGHALADKKLAVPAYQRSYAWEDEHVSDLFQDLAGALHAGDSEYFLGSIVTTKSESDHLEVVDGQQRLATTTILLAAIRDFFIQKQDDGRARSIEEKYLITTAFRSQETEPKLTLNEVDNNFFQCRILSRPDSSERKVVAQEDSHQRIEKAAELAKEYVEGLVKPHGNKSDVLMDLVEFLEKGARVIWVETPDQANAFLIFETLNDRGLELSISDLLKNYLYMRAEDRIPETRQRWNSMTTILEEETALSYIRHLWASLYGPTRERDLYVKIKDRIDSKKSAMEFAERLSANARLYGALVNPTVDFWQDFGTGTLESVMTLRQLQMEQLRPLLLAIVETFPKPDVKKYLRLLVSWSVRFLVSGGLGGGTLEKHYSQRAIEIRNGKIKSPQDLSTAMAGIVPSDSEFEEAFATVRVPKANLARYYLRVLERQTKGDPDPELIPNPDVESVNLEHILPQNPSAAWSHIDPDTAKAFAKRMGNMVLLKKKLNTKAGNDDFNAKKPIFQQSEYKLTADIATKYSSWGPNEIGQRQRELAALAVKAWPLQ